MPMKYLIRLLLVAAVVIALVAWSGPAITDLVEQGNRAMDEQLKETKENEGASKTEKIWDSETSGEEGSEDSGDDSGDTEFENTLQADALALEFYEYIDNLFRMDYKNCLYFIPELPSDLVENSIELSRDSVSGDVFVSLLSGAQQDQRRQLGRDFYIIWSGYTPKDLKAIYEWQYTDNFIVDTSTDRFIIRKAIDASSLETSLIQDSLFNKPDGIPYNNILIDNEQHFWLRTTAVEGNSFNKKLVPMIPVYYDSEGNVGFFVSEAQIEDIYPRVNVLDSASRGGSAPPAFIDMLGLNLFVHKWNSFEFRLCEDIDFRYNKLHRMVFVTGESEHDVCPRITNEFYCKIIDPSKYPRMDYGMGKCRWSDQLARENEGHGCYLVDEDENTDDVKEQLIEILNLEMGKAMLDTWATGTETLGDKVRLHLEEMNPGEACIFVTDNFPDFNTQIARLKIDNDVGYVGGDVAAVIEERYKNQEWVEVTDPVFTAGQLSAAWLVSDPLKLASYIYTDDEDIFYVYEERGLFNRHNYIEPVRDEDDEKVKKRLDEDYPSGSLGVNFNLDNKKVYVLRKEAYSYSVSVLPDNERDARAILMLPFCLQEQMCQYVDIGSSDNCQYIPSEEACNQYTCTGIARCRYYDDRCWYE